MDAGPKRQAKIARAIGKAAGDARRVLDSLDDTPSHQFDHAHYQDGNHNLEIALRELLEVLEVVNWERTAQVITRRGSARGSARDT